MDGSYASRGCAPGSFSLCRLCGQRLLSGRHRNHSKIRKIVRTRSSQLEVSCQPASSSGSRAGPLEPKGAETAPFKQLEASLELDRASRGQLERPLERPGRAWCQLHHSSLSGPSLGDGLLLGLLPGLSALNLPSLGSTARACSRPGLSCEATRRDLGRQKPSLLGSFKHLGSRASRGLLCRP